MAMPSTTATRIWKNKDLYSGFFAAGVTEAVGVGVFKGGACLCGGRAAVAAGITQDAMRALFPNC